MTEPTTTRTRAERRRSGKTCIDIFVSPAAVFRRRQNTSVWPPMLFVATVDRHHLFRDVQHARADLRRGVHARHREGDGEQSAVSGTPEMMEQDARLRRWPSAKYGLVFIIMISMFVIGCISWLVGKLFGSKQTYNAALVVAAWAYMPRILGALLGGIQGLLMDPANLNSQLSISLSPARFMDAERQTRSCISWLGRFDLITIWVTVLLAIGFYVTGKVPKGSAVVFAVLMWLIGAVPAIRQALV